MFCFFGLLILFVNKVAKKSKNKQLDLRVANKILTDESICHER